MPENNTIDRIPKNLYEAQLVIKKLEGTNLKLAEQNQNMSVSLSKANKKIEHLLAEMETYKKFAPASIHASARQTMGR